MDRSRASRLLTKTITAIVFVLLVLALERMADANSLELRITPSFGTEPIKLDASSNQLRSGETISITRLSYLLSGFSLQKVDGSWLELSNQFAWLDVDRNRTNALISCIPPASYRAIRFAIGLSPETNGSDPAQYAADHPLSPNLNGLHWSWQGGYIFLALEGHSHYRAQETKGFSYHFARDPNRTTISLPIQLNLSTNDARVELTFDLAKLFNAANGISPIRDGSSTHSREGDPIAKAFKSNLPESFSVQSVTAALSAPQIPALLNANFRDLPKTFTPYSFTISSKFPVPKLPADNPLLSERVELGRRLFQETLLSHNQKLSCASCHDSIRAFTDKARFSKGVGNQPGTRNAMPLFNLAWKINFFWDGRASSLREQTLMPIQDHLEMDESLTNVVAKLTVSTNYPPLFAAAFVSSEITPQRIGLALENFLLTLTSYDSKFDRAMNGQGDLSPEEKHGFELFFTEYEPRMNQRGADCFHCHGGALFTDHQFHNNGLDANHNSDPGRSKVTGKPSDNGKFSTPSLRNVALTAPYMHDGRFNTLEEVVEHYSTGVANSATLDPNLANHPVGGLQLSESDKRALVAFLKTLTDERMAGPGVQTVESVARK